MDSPVPGSALSLRQGFPLSGHRCSLQGVIDLVLGDSYQLDSIGCLAS